MRRRIMIKNILPPITIDAKGNERKTRVFINLDGTIFNPKKGLRPQTRELLSALRNRGYYIMVWSDISIEDIRITLREYDIVSLVDGYTRKQDVKYIELRPDWIIDSDDFILEFYSNTSWFVPWWIGEEDDKAFLPLIENIKRA